MQYLSSAVALYVSITDIYNVLCLICSLLRTMIKKYIWKFKKEYV